MIIIKHDEAPKIDNPHKVNSRKLYDKKEASIIHLTLEPGESLLKHITSVDVAFYVLEGKGTVQIGEEKKAVEQDTLIESPANIMHCWYNESEKKLRVLVIKTPKPTSPTKFLEKR